KLLETCQKEYTKYPSPKTNPSSIMHQDQKSGNLEKKPSKRHELGKRTSPCISVAKKSVLTKSIRFPHRTITSTFSGISMKAIKGMSKWPSTPLWAPKELGKNSLGNNGQAFSLKLPTSWLGHTGLRSTLPLC